MSTRVIASVGVVLCVAMTSFSIYLGVIEHVYAPVRSHAALLSTPGGQRELICISVEPHNTTTTNGTKTYVTSGPCPAGSRR